MGRKNKGGLSTGQNYGNKGATSRDENKLSELTDVLLKMCSTEFPVGSKAWNEYLDIQKILKEVLELEKEKSPRFTKREENFDRFLQWLTEHGVSTDNVTIERFDKEGWGLRAQNDISEGQVWLSVPFEIMLTSSMESSSHLASFLSSDPVVKHMPQIMLALRLLEEFFNKGSLWRSYLDVLPSHYNTILYYTPDELELLKGSPCLEEALKHIRHIVRQYAYYWRLFHANDKRPPHNFDDKFTFAAYRWAVSTVMTRQNIVPSFNGSETLHALVPLWDMCNHAPGKISTDFNLEKRSLECYASSKYLKGDQIFIFYGERSNAEFFVHNAFVEQNNDYESVAVKLGLSKNDMLAEKKRLMLQKLNIQPNETFFITKTADPIPGRLIAFVRVFCMEAGDLNMWAENPDYGNIEDFFQLESSLDEALKKKAWSYLQVRLSLLLKGYPTTLQEDVALMADDLKMSTKVKNAVLLRIGEKKILQDALTYVTQLCQ